MKREGASLDLKVFVSSIYTFDFLSIIGGPLLCFGVIIYDSRLFFFRILYRERSIYMK